MHVRNPQPGLAFRLGIRIGPLRVPLWVFTLAVMLVAAVAGQAIGPREGGEEPLGPVSTNPIMGIEPAAPRAMPILSPPLVRQGLTEPGRRTTVELRNNGRECDLRIETIQLAAQGYVESSRIDRYVDAGCDGRVESVLYGGFFDREPASEAFFQERDREYAAWLHRLGVN